MDSVGGSELQSLKMAKEFSKRNNEVYFWSHNINPNIYPDLNGSSSSIKLLKSRSSSNWFFSLINIVKNIKPDIIYTRDTRRLFIYAFISHLLRVPLVYNINHDVRSMPYNLLQLNNIIYRDSRAYGFFPAWAIFGYLATKCYSYISKIISQTYEQQEYLAAQKIESETIYNGHEVPSIINKPNGSRCLIVWIGSLKKEIKRPHIFLYLASQFRHLDVAFKYCGSFTENNQYNKYLKLMTERLENVEYLGKLSIQEVQRLLKDSYIMINTSKVESFPNTFIEAWMHGIPVISLSVDPDNIISSNDMGFLGLNINKVVDNIKKLLNDEKLYMNHSKKSRTFAINNFTLELIIKKYDFIFKDIISEGKIY